MQLRINCRAIFRKNNTLTKCINISNGATATVPAVVISKLFSYQEIFSDAFLFEACAASPDEIAAEECYFALRVAEIVVECDKSPLDSNDHCKPQWNWDEFGWSLPELFIEASRMTKFVQGDPEGLKEQERQGYEIAAQGDGPGISRASDEARKIKEFRVTGEIPDVLFSDVLSKRRTKRKFRTNTEIDLCSLAGVLSLCARAQRVWVDRNYGEQMFRSSPSGGARHPVEIYPQVIRSPDLESGNYLYCPIQHGLAKLGEVDSELIFKAGQQQEGCRDGCIAFVITTRYPRNFWKYRYARSFLFSHYDVGHLVQTLVLSLTAYGYGTFLTPAVRIDLLSNYLEVANPLDETPSYLIMGG